jgi:hypothetical protein
MALPRLGSCFCENRAIAGVDFCCFSCSLLFKGLLGGNGTRAALFTTVAQVSATDKAVTTTALLALEAEHLVPIVRGCINRRQNLLYEFSRGVLIPFDHSSHGCHALFARVAVQSKTITEQPK